MSPATSVRELAWIDTFFREVRRHVWVREEDGVLILPPNQVYRLNEGGLRVVRHLAAGRRIARLPGLADGERAADVEAFARDFAAFYRGEPAPQGGPSVQRVAYGFDFTRLPVLGEIAVTYRCNNACRFCYAGCGSGSGCGPARVEGPEMTLREIRRVIDIFRDHARIPFFSFTGGEPLLRPDLDHMIRHARRRGLAVNLVTNGTLADAGRAHSLRRAGLETAQVSVEAPDAATHDRLTASPGSFRRTLAGIACLRDAGVRVQTNTTITALNAEGAPRMPAFLAGLGVERFAMNLYIPDPDSPHAGRLFLPYTKVGPVVETVRRAAKESGLVFYWYSPTPHCLYNPIARGLGNKSCAAMDGLLSVSPSGDVLPCSSYARPMGNLLREDFRSIWFSDEAAYFKQKRYAPEACAGCGGFTACQAACPLYWRYAGTSEISAAVAAGGRGGGAWR